MNAKRTLAGVRATHTEYRQRTTHLLEARARERTHDVTEAPNADTEVNREIIREAFEA